MGSLGPDGRLKFLSASKNFTNHQAGAQPSKYNIQSHYRSANIGCVDEREAILPPRNGVVMNKAMPETAPGSGTKAAAQSAVLAMIGAVLCWGTGPVMSKTALNFAGPIFLLVIQLAASLIFLFTAIVVTKNGRHLNRDVIKPALTGILEPGLGYGLGNIGLMTTTVSALTLLGPSEAVFTCALGFLLFKKRPNRVTLLSIVSISVGVALIVAPSLSGRRDVGSFVGNMYVLGGDFAAALYITLSSKLVETKSPLVLAFAQEVVGLAMAIAWLGFSLMAGY